MYSLRFIQLALLFAMVSGCKGAANHKKPDQLQDNQSVKGTLQSGLEIGEDAPSFIPYHAWGPDKGSTACPVCKYGWYHGILYFVGNKPNWKQIRQWLIFLEGESRNRGKYLKVYFIYGNEAGYTKTAREQELAQLGTEINLKYLALTYVPSLTDKKTEVDLYRIHPEAENTILIYRRRKVIGRYVNLMPSQQNFELIIDKLNKTRDESFNLPPPIHE